MVYNSNRTYLNMKEYGRNIQQMVDEVVLIEDDERRHHQAKVLIEIMAILNPHLKNMENFKHKLWDHLIYMSNFKLNVPSPYPMPERETVALMPAPLTYPKRKPKYNHLGKNLELVINKALAEEDPEKKLGFSNSIAYYMKLSYNNYHKENIHDETIRAELTAITKGQLDFTQTGYVKFYRGTSESNVRSNRNNNGRNFRNNNNRSNNGAQNSGARRNSNGNNTSVGGNKYSKNRY